MSKTPDIFTPPVGISPPDANYLDEVVSANTIIDERTGARSVNRTAIDRAIDFHNNAERANRPRSNVSSEELLRRRLAEVDIKKNFNPYRYKDNVEPFMGGYPIIFMTTPSMNIYKGSDSNTTSFGSVADQLFSTMTPVDTDNSFGREIIDTLAKSSSIFSYYNLSDKDLVQALTYGNGGTKSPWIKFLTNLFKGIQLKDVSMRTTDEYETYYGYKQILPGPNIDSFTADNVTVNFNETKNLDVIKFHYLWAEYIEAVRYGVHSPSKSMRSRRSLDYTSSLYYFLLDADFMSILYCCKYTGLFPINIPTSLLSSGDINTRGPIDVSITYAYQGKEEFAPTIIYDFNAIAKYPAQVLGFGRSADSLFGDNMDKYFDGTSLMNSTGYGQIDIDDSYFKKPLTRYEHSFSNVQIRLLNNNSYNAASEGQNQTAYASDMNLSKQKFIMCFGNDTDEGFNTTNQRLENPSTAQNITNNIIGRAGEYMNGNNNENDHSASGDASGVAAAAFNNLQREMAERASLDQDTQDLVQKSRNIGDMGIDELRAQLNEARSNYNLFVNRAEAVKPGLIENAVNTVLDVETEGYSEYNNYKLKAENEAARIQQLTVALLNREKGNLLN